MHGKFSEPVAARKGENGRAAERETAIASATVRNSALTVGMTRAIITTGRDDACGELSPPVWRSRLPVSAGWRLYFFFFLLLPSRPNLIALSTREATIMTTEMISKSDMISPPQLSYLEAKSQAPSVFFLPEAQGLHCYYSIAARARQIMFSNVFNFFVPLSEKTGDFRKIAELRGKSQISTIYIGYAYIYNRRSGW